MPINGRIQQKHDLERNWRKAVNFTPLKGELIIYDAEIPGHWNELPINDSGQAIRTKFITIPRYKIGDGITKVNDLEFVSEPIVYYIANPSNVNDIIAKALPNSTIILESGEYEQINLVANRYNEETDKYETLPLYPENLTITISDNTDIDSVSVAGVLLDSGFKQNYYFRKSDIINSVMPKGLTFRNICFTKDVVLQNCGIENLSIQGCYFDTGSTLQICPNDIVAGGTSYRYLHASTKVTNLYVRGCTFVESASGNKSAIFALDVNGATISNNTINNRPYNAIQIGSRSGRTSTGLIKITENTITGTKSRGIRISALENARLEMLSNYLSDVNLTDKNDEYVKISGCYNTEYVFKTGGDNSNKYNGIVFGEGNGILISDPAIRTITDHKHTIEQITNLDSKLSSYATTTSIKEINDQLDTFVKKSQVYKAIPSNFIDVLKAAEAGSTIQLVQGEDGSNTFNLDLTLYNSVSTDGSMAGVINTRLLEFKDNITIMGSPDIMVDGVTLSSGISQAFYYSGNTEEKIAMSIYPKGLTFKDIHFINHFKVFNCGIENLTVENCKFEIVACMHIRPNVCYYNSAIGLAPSSPAYRYNTATTKVKNLILKNNNFMNSTTIPGTEYKDVSRIMIQDVENAEIVNNVVDYSKYSSIQISGSSAWTRYCTGTFVIKNNVFRYAVNRPLRLTVFDTASILIADNYFADCGHKETLKIDKYFRSFFITQGNSVEGKQLTSSMMSTDGGNDSLSGSSTIILTVPENNFTVIEHDDGVVEFVL